MGAVCVTSLEIALICLIIALATMIQIYATFKIVQIGTAALVNRSGELDSTLAEAIASVVENGLGSFEPPNPIVSILADYMKSNLNPSVTDVKVIERDRSGKFTGNQE